MATLEDYFFTKNTRYILWGVGAVIIALLIFHAGVVVGSHQSVRGRMVLQGSGTFGGFIPSEAYVESGHGAVGTIESVALPTFLLQTRDGAVQKIYASTSTIVTGKGASGISSIISGETVIVIGDPDDTDDQGYLDARIIHILPAPAPLQASSSNNL
ncbi:MAG TPA: hypothetical protein VIJ88_01220 [Candidatus Paceibacterota bacterium]